MATKSRKRPPAAGDAASVSAKVGDEFMYAESKTLVHVTCVNKDEDTVDVQEPGEGGRYWGDVPANTDWLQPVEK